MNRNIRFTMHFSFVCCQKKLSNIVGQGEDKIYDEENNSIVESYYNVET